MKLIIVEDEYYSRKYFNKLLGQMGEEIEVIGQYETGHAAVQSSKLEEADIVLTDIRMPEMDGLELSKYINEKYPKVRVLIVTGYADFAYAQQAIRYNVKNYLTKPVKDAELMEAIWNIVNEMKEEKENIIQQVNQQMTENLLQYFSIKEVLGNSEFRERLLGDIKDSLENGYWVMIILQDENHSSELHILSEMSHLCEEKYHKKVFYFRHHAEYVIFLFGEQAFLEQREYVESINRWIDKCGNNFSRLTAGASRIHHGETPLMKAYAECIDAICMRIIRGEQCLYEIQDPHDCDKIISSTTEIKLLDGISANNMEAVEQEIRKQFLKIRGSDIDIYALQKIMLQLYSIINKNYSKREEYDTEWQQTITYFKNGLSNFYTMNQLEQHIVTIFRRACEENKGKADSEIISEIKQYVEENYSYDISLSELAVNRFFMNASYLSRLFKAQAGKNFSKYLAEYRVKQAKELLMDSDIKIADIAMYVGFNSISHFGTIFKKYTDQTPEQYRKDCKKREQKHNTLNNR